MDIVLLNLQVESTVLGRTVTKDHRVWTP